jgi:hypothetical protein
MFGGFLTGVFVRWPMTYNMSGLNMALQWHLWAPHVHGNNHVNIMFLAVVCYNFLHSYSLRFKTKVTFH